MSAWMTHLAAGRLDEAASLAREALALTRRLGARANEAHALCLLGDVASAAGADDAERSYREALTLAVELGMRPPHRPLPPRSRQALPAHGPARAGAGASHHGDDDVSRDGNDVLAGAGRGRVTSPVLNVGLSETQIRLAKVAWLNERIATLASANPSSLMVAARGALG